MASDPSGKIRSQRIESSDALQTLLRSFDGLSNNPASLYLSNTSHNLIIYVAPTRVVNTISLSYLGQALSEQDRNAVALKGFLETGTTTLVFFDARPTAKILFESCDIKLSKPPCTERARIHEVQMIELAVRKDDYGRKWLAGLDSCIARDSELDVSTLLPSDSNSTNQFDSRILHLPMLWKKYHKQLHVAGAAFWIAKIRTDIQLRLAVSCGEYHNGYDAEGARSSWDRERLEEEMEAWNEELEDDIYHDGEILGDEHWAKFELL